MLIVEESKEEYAEIVGQPIHAYQDASVCIPVEITPRADSGEIKTSCCGEPTVTFHEDCGSNKYCFTIIQPVCVEISLELSAEALLGNLHVNCGDETDVDCKPICEKTDADCKSVCEEICEVSSSEQESPRPILPKKHYYKVYF